jgi:hypothetical protein
LTGGQVRLDAFGHRAAFGRFMLNMKISHWLPLQRLG